MKLDHGGRWEWISIEQAGKVADSRNMTIHGKQLWHATFVIVAIKIESDRHGE